MADKVRSTGLAIQSENEIKQKAITRIFSLNNMYVQPKILYL